jgi:4-hydroxybenzoate polyprenyltransferase
MIFARSAAMAFNRFLDHQFDALNPRTAIREIPAGIIKPRHALIFTITNCLLFIFCTYLINSICFYLSGVALFVILFYSYTKRFTSFCHIILGIGLSLAPIGSFIALTGIFNIVPLLFSMIVICWVSGFDIIYALQDESFDKENKLHSIPTFFGKQKALFISSILHTIAALIVIIYGFNFSHTLWFWFGAVIFLGMLIFQHSIVKPNDLSKVNIAFMTSNGIASVVFSIFVIIDILISNKFL